MTITQTMFSLICFAMICELKMRLYQYEWQTPLETYMITYVWILFQAVFEWRMKFYHGIGYKAPSLPLCLVPFSCPEGCLTELAEGLQRDA